MSNEDRPRDQTILVLFCTIISSACAQLGVSLLFHEWNGPIGAIILLALAFGAIVVAIIWPNMKGKLSTDLLSRFVEIVVERRFTLAVICFGLVALLNVWPRSWHLMGPQATRLVLVFPATSSNPTEKISSNVHWSHWSGLQGDDTNALIDGDGRPEAEERYVWAKDVTVLFLRFDAPVDYDRLTLAMADLSRVPEAKTYRKDDRTAVLVIHGRIKRGVELTIAPVSDVQRDG